MTSAKLRASAKEIAVRVVDEMYADPFWMRRYGDRGRARSEEDLAYHVEYLAQAIDARDPGIMARYADWLRTVLTSRGMCTLHLDASFRRLGAALPADLANVAASPLTAARMALRYPAGPAREIQSASRAICDAAIAELRARTPERCRESTTHEAEHLVSYLADALATGKDDAYRSYVSTMEQGELVGLVARHVGLLSAETADRATEVLAG